MSDRMYSRLIGLAVALSVAGASPGLAGERALFVTVANDGDPPFAAFYCAPSCEEVQPLPIGGVTLHPTWRIEVENDDTVSISPLSWSYGQFIVAGRNGSRFHVGREEATVWITHDGLLKPLVRREPPGIMGGKVMVTVASGG